MRIPESVGMLERDLRMIFGPRFRSLVMYGDAGIQVPVPIETLVIVDAMTPDDLRACTDRVSSWHDAGLATPLVLGAQEFDRSLDAFPYEFGAILAEHVVVAGANPFEGLRVDPAHMRHACEVQARSHLLHLREGYLETRGRSDALAELLARSAAPFSALVKSVARLRNADAADSAAAAALVERELDVAAGSLTRIVDRPAAVFSSDEARRVFPAYLEAVERLTQYIDCWKPDAQQQ
jgi:hypothetical protein